MVETATDRHQVKPHVTFEEWCVLLDAYHEGQRKKGEFEGYGPGSVTQATGAECWRIFYDDGYCPSDALDEDRECWGAD